MQSQAVVKDKSIGERRLVMLGASAGETIECDSPAGRRRLSIEDVVHQPERSLRTYLFTRSPAAARG